MALRYTARFYTIPTLGSHVYDIEIDDANFVGEVKQLELGSGGVVLDYEGDEQDTFPTIIPSYLTINLIADESFQLNHIYTDNERALRVTLKQDGQFLGNYFVIPDGTRESFTSFPYDVSIRCVDGLGLLKNYEYTTIEGKDSIFNIIRKCLNNLGLSLNINTFCRTAYEGGGGSLDDQYRFVYVQQERFIGMRCDEVLEQLLKEWVSGLMQMNGEWYLFRWPDLIRTPETVPFSKYDSSGTFIGTISINTDYILGTDGESGLDLMHVNYDQVRSVNMAYKSVRIRYEYGALENLLNKDTATLLGSSSINFEGWDKIGGINAVPRLPYSFENSGEYALINGRLPSTVGIDGTQYLQLKEKINVTGIDMLKLSITFNVSVANAMAYMVIYEDDVQKLYLRPDETWGTIYLWRFTNYVQEGEDTYGLGQKIRGEETFSLEGITKVGTPTIDIRLYPSYFLPNNIYSGHPGIAKVYEVKLQRTNGDDDIISETHEVVNNGSYTTIPDPIEVSTGENFFEGYEGTMFKSDQVTPTNGFRGVGDVNYIPFLTLAARDILFQHGRPMTRYEGSILGYFPILSRLTINDLPGVYMPVRLSYDFKNNIVNSSLNEVNADPVPHTVSGIVYEY